jgi:hypothetical protein
MSQSHSFVKSVSHFLLIFVYLNYAHFLFSWMRSKAICLSSWFSTSSLIHYSGEVVIGSMGVTISMSEVNSYGDVVVVLGVAWYDHKTSSISSDHFSLIPPYFLRNPSMLFSWQLSLDHCFVDGSLRHIYLLYLYHCTNVEILSS